MILLTSCLQKLQQLKDKMNIFDQVVLIEENNSQQFDKTNDESKVLFDNNENDDEICTFHL